MRLFIAIQLNEEMKAALTEIQAGLRRGGMLCCSFCLY